MTPTPGQWQPLGATSIDHPPPAHRLFAFGHAVWHVDQVVWPAPITDTDRAAWEEAGCPDPADPGSWHGWPYTVDATWVAGWRDEKPAGPPLRLRLRSAARTGYGRKWWIYPPSNRFPRCSCCGEPMPCRQDLIDTQVAAEAAALDWHASKLPGCCWACAEPITSRQQSVIYAGDNLDLPGGPDVQFHTRISCVHEAKAYEKRWLAADPDRTPILLTGAGCTTVG